MRRALLAAVVACAACSHGSAPADLVDVKKADLVIGVDINGELAALDSTDLKPPILQSTWDFKIQWLAAEGSDVKEGDVVAKFDLSKMMQDMEKVQANEEEASTKLAKKRDEAALSKKNVELDVQTQEAELQKKQLEANVPPDLRGSIDAKTAQLDVESAKLLLDSAKHKAEQQLRSDEAEIHTLEEQMAEAKDRVAQLQKDIPQMHVTAPRAGTLIYPATRFHGEKIKVDDPVWRGFVMLQVVALGNMIGKGEVDEVDSARVTEGQPVTLRLDALPDLQLHGKVKHVLPALHPKTAADPSKVVDLEIAIDPQKDAPLRPGMRFRGQVEIEHLKDVVQVPTEAVQVTPDGPVAWVQRGGKLERATLVLGHRNGNAIEVKSGLAEGDRVSRTPP